MADVSNHLRNRIVSIVLGFLMIFTSFWLIISTKFTLDQLLYTFSPYPFYFLSLILGIERLIYGITGSLKILKIFLGRGELLSISIYTMFILLLSLGAYELFYIFLLSDKISIIMEVLNSLGYFAFAYILFRTRMV
jgi:hypothetical protein